MNTGSGASGSASPLGDRYKVIRELGRGGFGQTYLAEDRHRYDELCVVKEFIPQIEDKDLLAKAKELFEREASVLYQLDHKQIPEFRQLLEVESETGGRLFIVQDYIAGPTYQSLLEDRQRFGGQFNETEITQLLYQLLPVLSYVHSLGLVHRDISPDNLILRQTDGLPVLIDFGSVKEVAASVRSQLSLEGMEPATTRIGKVGYVPQEQLSAGRADASSDLYGLGATLLVLATGKDPQVLHDPYHGIWSGYEVLSPELGKILEKMLAADPEDRFQTAESVLAALEQSEHRQERSHSAAPDDLYGDNEATAIGDSFPLGPSRSDDDQVPLVIPPGLAGEVDPSDLRDDDTATDEPEVYELGTEPEAQHIISQPNSTAATVGVILLVGLFSMLLALTLLRRNNSPQPQGADTSGEFQPLQEGEFSPEETARKQEIATRREALGIDEGYFTRLIDQLFYQEYPNLLTSGPGGERQALSDAAADEPLRLRWDNIALNLLDKLENNFGERSLSAVGSYSEDSDEALQRLISSVDVGERSLYDLVDAKFFMLFPAQAGRDFLTQPIAQLYYALADDTARAIESGTLREDVQFAPGTFSQDIDGSLEPGEGKVYTLRLSEGQQMRLNLTAPADSTLLSLYPPEPTDDSTAPPADSERTTWSGAATQSGYYQVVVVNRSAEPISYQLALSVDNVTSEPVEPDESDEFVDSDPDNEPDDEPDNEPDDGSIDLDPT
ncbi:MAG: serine/threonine-protein kinase [Phormidesmis sp.]